MSYRSSKKRPKARRPRKLTSARADAINRKRDAIDGHERSYEHERVRVRPGRGQTVKE